MQGAGNGSGHDGKLESSGAIHLGSHHHACSRRVMMILAVP
jgi:hypothetical protein